ncbi:MAG: beta-lactamase family protein [Actinobacteria bacterium]|nr:beta-lactamase family protein [Actinomycetota bacterium]
MDRLVAALERHRESGIVGAAAAVVVGDEVAWWGGVGSLDHDRDEPVTVTTSFPIQSVTKPLVAAALVQQMHAGAFALDDRVNRYLEPVRVTNPWEQSSPITIRQLFTHTAGLPATFASGGAPTLEEAVATEIGAAVEPGTAMVYANTGYDALGYLLQRVTGSDWDVAVRDIVLSPLGMHATGAGDARADARHRATGHIWSAAEGRTVTVMGVPSAYAAPSGSMVSNVEDLARFLVAMLNEGGGVLAAEAVASMQRLHAPLGSGFGGMGLGLRVDHRRERRFFCHGGDGAGFTAFVGGHPGERVGVVLLMNTGGADVARSNLVRVALECVLDGTGRTAYATAAASSPRASRYRSTFWNVRAEVTVGDGMPELTVPAGTISFDEGVSRLAPAGSRWFADGGVFDGWELEFASDSDGRPCFSGGVYPYLFRADDTPIIGLPHNVDTTADVGGAWVGTADTPFGPLPLGVEVDAGARRVTVDIMGMTEADTAADADGGWVRGEVPFDVPGVGPITVFVRLGVIGGRLEGLLYARTQFGEFGIPTTLSRSTG